MSPVRTGWPPPPPNLTDSLTDCRAQGGPIVSTTQYKEEKDITFRKNRIGVYVLVKHTLWLTLIQTILVSSWLWYISDEQRQCCKDRWLDSTQFQCLMVEMTGFFSEAALYKMSRKSCVILHCVLIIDHSYSCSTCKYMFVCLLELGVFGIFQFPPLGYDSSFSIQIMKT